MPKDISLTGYILRVIKPYKLFLLIGLIASGLYGIIDAFLIWLIKPLLDDGFVAHDQGFIHKLPMILLAIFVCRSLCAYVSQYMLAKVSYQSAAALKEHLFEKLLRYPSCVYENQPPGEFITRIGFQTTKMATSMSEALSVMSRECVTILGLLIVMLMASPFFTILYLLSLPLSIAVFTYVGKKSRMMQQKVNIALEEKNNHIQEVVYGHLVVKSFGGHLFELKKFQKLLGHNLLHELKEARVMAQGAAFIQFIGGVVIITIITLSTTIGRSHITGGDFACLITAILALLRPIKQLTKVNEIWQRALASANNLILLESYPQEDIQQHEKTKANNTNPARLAFINVSYQYGQDVHTEVLRDISFELERGQTLAIVGPSGGGKSTLVSLVLRLYEYQGTILLDGQDIKTMPLSVLREKTAFVSQHITLFNESIAANIAYGYQEIDWVAVKRAAQLAYASDFIEALPQGYLTLLGSKGHRLSGGQRQRLALARAFYKQASLLILDEATSALDTESEDKIQHALASLMAQSSTLVIAHRLSTIINAHQILVIDKGRLVEQGTHEELIKKQGIYTNLYQQVSPDEATLY